MNRVYKNVKLTFLVVFLLAFIIAIFAFLSFDNALGSDFVSFLTGAYILKEGKGELLYNLDTQYLYQGRVIAPRRETSILPFENLPILAFALIPFTYFSLLTAYKIFVFFSFLTLLIVSFLVFKNFPNLSGKFFLIFLPLLFYPSVGSLFSGQLTPFLVLLFLLIYINLKGKKFFVAGLLTALLFLKVQYSIAFFPILAFVREKKPFIKGFAVSSLTLVGLSTLLVGKFFFPQYFKFLFFVQKPEYGIRSEDMFTLQATLEQLKIFPKLSYFELFFINFLLYGVFVLSFSKDFIKRNADLAFALTVIATMVFCVHGVNYDYALTLIPLFILLERVFSQDNGGILGKLVILTLITTPIFFVLKKALFVSFVLIETLILLILEEFKKQKALV